MAYTVKYSAGVELTGLDAEIAEMEECEPYNLATIEIPEIQFSACWDDRQPQEVDHVAVAHRIAKLPELEAVLKRADKMVDWLTRHLANYPGVLQDLDRHLELMKQMLVNAKADSGVAPDCQRCGGTGRVPERNE